MRIAPKPRRLTVRPPPMVILPAAELLMALDMARIYRATAAFTRLPSAAPVAAKRERAGSVS